VYWAALICDNALESVGGATAFAAEATCKLEAVIHACPIQCVGVYTKSSFAYPSVS
jgi:hypothetical protein